MRRIPSLLLLSTLVLGTALHGLTACSDDSTGGSAASPPGPDGGGDAASEPSGPPIPAGSKIDVLLVVDNSASMSDKAKLLAGSIGTLMRDFAKGGDVHLGVIDTSLGNLGGDVCSASNPRTNSKAHLRTTDENDAPVAGVKDGVLAYAGGDVEAFVQSASSLVRGVGETGCGFEAQLESTYRFLVQPDPWSEVKVDPLNQQADLGTAIDSELLAQRKAFLRSDSALVVLMLTDEDDSSVDPLAVAGQGWAFAAKQFPGSKVFRGVAGTGTTAPRGTSVCATNPASPDCTSCGFAALCDTSDPTCQKLKSDPSCTASALPGQSGDGYDGYYGPADDELNVRFHRMKERFGIDPQYPISRYVDGFTKAKVPDQGAEHVITENGGSRVVAPYSGTAKCTNPIFAASLPSSASDELCNLPAGTRSPELVLFAVLGGLPPALATDTPDWKKILGNDPDAYDSSGIDPHMIQSIEPRAGLEAPSATRGDNGSDPVHGREWTTEKRDLQYACTFALPQPRTCDPADPSCECSSESTANPPLCTPSGDQQIRAKSYPTPRPLRLAKGLGDRAVVGSICSDSYDTTMKKLSARLATRLTK